MHDVAIVGAGFSGITAARELSRAGHDVVVLEGRERIGGRTWFKEMPELGHSFELGGTWVHWQQPHVFSELTRYGLELTESVGVAAPETIIYRTGEQLRVRPVEAVWPLLESSLTRFFGSETTEIVPRPFQPLFAAERVAAIDGISLQERIDALDFSPEERDLVNAMWSLCASTYCSEVAYMTMVRWYALSAHSVAGVFDTCTRYKIKAGTKSLVDAMYADCEVELRLGERVAAVRQSEDRVRVELTSGDAIEAREALITVPINCLAEIEFEPALSAGKRAIAAERQPSRGLKLFVRAQGPGLEAPLFAMAPETEVLHYAHTEVIDDEGQILVAFGPDPERIADVDSVAAVEPHLRRLLGDQIQLRAVVGKSWLADDFARGAWCVFRPGQLTSHLIELQRPEGRVRIIGSDTADGWNGFIDGAIESGLRASRELAARLRQG